MRYKTLGNTSVPLSVVGQGTGIGGYSKEITSYSDLLDTLRRGIELGMNLIDTAPVYGQGEAEQVVGQAIAGIREKVLLATKVPPGKTSAADVVGSLEQSLRRLRVECVDLYQIHWSNPKVPIAETMKAMSKLTGDGKIRFVGVSNFTLSELKAARAALQKDSIVSLQAEYNLFDRTAEKDLLPYCEQHQISFIAYSPLRRGKIVGDARRLEKLSAIAAEQHCTPAQMALRWLIERDPVVIIPNTVNPKRVEENAAAADLKLTQEDYRRIEEQCASEPEPVPTEAIQVASEDGRPAYETLGQAKENRMGFSPSPKELADQIRTGEFLKPVHLIRLQTPVGPFKYRLVEGRIRYWAWVIAHEKNPAPIPALIETSNE